MSNPRKTSFNVEALESRILLSAAPMDAGLTDSTENDAQLDTPVWEVGQAAENQPAPVAPPTEEIFHGPMLPLAEGESSPEALSTTSYGDGLTQEPAIFINGFTVIESGATRVFQSTTGGIFFSGPGAIDGTAPAGTHENVHLISAGEISIDGPIGGTSPIHNLVVSAGSNIFFGGSINLTGDLIIEAGAQVTFDRDVTVAGDIIIGDSANPGDIARVVFTSRSAVNVGGEIEIFTSGTVDFRNEVGVSVQPSSVTIVAGQSINAEQDFFAGVLDLTAQNVTFHRALRVAGIDPAGVAVRITAADLLNFRGIVEVGNGDALLTANRMSFTGGSGAVQSKAASSDLILRPFNPARPIGIGDPSGGDFNRLQISHIELNAIHNSFAQLIIGDLTAGTGEVRIGNIGLAQPTAIAQIQNTATFVGGSVLVESRIDVDAQSDYLRLIARTGNIVVNGAINQSVTERNNWVRLEAQGDIYVNQPIFARDRISLAAGYEDGTGSVFVQSTGANSGQLFTTNTTAADRRIEISAGAISGNISIVDGVGQTTLSAAGVGSSIALQAPGGTITQVGGLLRAEVLAMLADGNITATADIARLGEVTIAGESLFSGAEVAIDGIRITGTGSLDLTVLHDLVIDRIETAGGDISIDGGNDLFLAELDALGGAINLTAAGAIIDHLAGTGVVNLTTAGHVTLIARNGIGGPGDLDIDTEVGTLSARNEVSGGIFVQNRGSLTLAGFLETEQGDGSIAIVVDTGNLTVDTAVFAHGAGSVLLRASAGDLILDGAVTSATGHVALIAQSDLVLLEDASVATALDGTVLLRAETGSVEMDGTVQISAVDSNLRIEAGAGIVLGNLTASEVSLVAGNGSIRNAADSILNVTASILRMEAGQEIGDAVRHLTLAVERLAVHAADGIYLAQNGAVVVTEIDPIAVEVFAADGTFGTATDGAALAGLVTANTGNIVLIATDGAIEIESPVNAGGVGNIRLEAGDVDGNLSVAADVGGNGGSVSLISAGGLVFAPDVTVQALLAGSIYLRALGGSVVMDASNRLIAPGGGVRVVASDDLTLGQIEAVDASVISESGSIFSADGSSVNITATTLRMEAEKAIGTAAGSILTAVALVSANARGASATEKGIYLSDSGGITIGSVAFAGDEVLGDGSISAANDAEQSGLVAGGEGDVVMVAVDDLAIAATASVDAEGEGTVFLQSVNGAFTMIDGATVSTEAGEITISAEEDIRLATVSSLSGALKIESATGAILDNLAASTPNLATGGFAELHAAAGIGAAAGALVTSVGELAASNTTSGLIAIRQIGDVVITVDGITNQALNGSVLFETVDGSIELNGPVFAASGGKLLVRAGGADSDLTVNASVTAEAGPISLLAGRGLAIAAAVLTENGGTIDLWAENGDVAIAAAASVIALDSDIRIRAGNDLYVTGVDAGTGNVHLSALNGSVIDGGDVHDRDVIAASLRIFAFGGVGADAPLAIDVSVIAATAVNGSIRLSELDDIIVGTVSIVTVERVGMDDTVAPVADPALASDLVAEEAGDISLISETGSITIEDGVSADGIGVRSAGGDLLLQAAVAVAQNAHLQTTGSGNIIVIAEAGDITMAVVARTSTVSGNVSYSTDGDIFLSLITSVDGDFTIEAGDRIVDNIPAETPNLVTLGHAALIAVNGIGDLGGADIDTSVGSLSARNTESGRIVIDEVDGLIVSGTGIANLGGGEVIVTVRNGDLRVEAPIQTEATGAILLRAIGTGADLFASAAIISAGGHITVHAARTIDLLAGAGITSGASGTVTLQAVAGSIAMEGTVLVDGGSGDMRVTAANQVSLGGLTTTGNVIVAATAGSILNNSATLVNVTATGARLNANIGIGLLGGGATPVTTDVAVITARATSGGINILESSTVATGNVIVLTQRVNVDGTLTAVTEAAQSDLRTTGSNGSIVFRTIDGGITLNEGSAPAGNIAVLAHGSGNILIEAAGTGASITAHADVRTTSGNVTVIAAGTITFLPGADILTGTTGNIVVEATAGSVVMHDTARFNTGSGSIRVVAGTDILVANIVTTGNAALIAGGSILDNGDSAIDINVHSLLINAGDGVGSLGSGTSNALEVITRRLTARAGEGGVNLEIRNTLGNDLAIGDVTVSVNRVAADGTVSPQVAGAQSDVRTVEGNGSIVLRLPNGASLRLEPGTAPGEAVAVSAHGSGNILIETLHVLASIIADGGIESGTGHITLSSSLGIAFGGSADIRTGGTGGIDLRVQIGFIEMANGSRFVAEDGDIRLAASTDVLLGGVQTGGNVSIISNLGSILDNGSAHIDVIASGLRLFAHTDIGILVPIGVGGGPNPLDIDVDTLSARALVGDINILEQTSLAVGDVAVTIHRVGADGTTTLVTDAAQSDLRTGDNGSIVLRSLDGDIVLNGGSDSPETAVSADGTGNILIETVGAGRGIQSNADIHSGVGHVTLTAAGSVAFAGHANITIGGTGTIVISTATGDVVQSGLSRFTATDGDIRISAGASIELGGVTTGGNVSLIASGGSIVNRADPIGGENVIADQLRMVANVGIGESDTHLSTHVSTLSARAASGGVFVLETDALTIGDTSASVWRVNPDNTLEQIIDSTLSDVATTGGNGSIVLRTLAGDIVLNDGTAPTDNTAVSADGSGNILIQALGAGTNIQVNADVRSGIGHVTIFAFQNLTIASQVTVATAGDGAVLLTAESGTLIMAGDAHAVAAGNTLRLAAAGDVIVGNLLAVDASIVSENGSIINAAGSTRNVTATRLHLSAAQAIATADRHLTTAVAHIAASANGAGETGIYVTEDTAVTISTVDILFLQVTSNADVISASESQSGLVAGNNGNIVLVALAGSITAEQIVDADGSGNILLDARGTDSNLTVNADVRSGIGHITLKAAADIAVEPGAMISTAAAGSISVDAIAGSLTMAGTASIIAFGGSLRLHALEDVTLGNLTAADVSIIAATGSILNAAGSAKNVTADNLRLEADQAIGQPGRHLSTAVAHLTARAAGAGEAGIYITEDDAVTVTTVGVTVTEFHADATTSTVTDADQSDLVTGNNGNIILIALDGSITLTDGDNVDGIAVHADGSGNILIDARGSGSSLVVDANVQSATGHLTLMAAADMTVAGNVQITTAAPGTISLVAVDGSMTLAGTSQITATAASLRLAANGDILVSNLTAADVSIVSTEGSIFNATGSIRNVTATNLRLEAGGSVGVAGRHLTTAITNITANAAGSIVSGIYVTEETGATIAAISVSVSEVGADASTTVLTDATQAGLTTGSSGNIVLVALAGGIVGAEAVDADGSGSILLDARGVGSDLILNANVASATGHVTLKAADAITIAAAVNIATAAPGTVSLSAAAGAITMDGTATITALDGSLRIDAEGDVILGNLTGAGVSVLSATGSILNAAGSVKNVTATDLRLDAAGAIGESARHLTTAVAILTARANGANATGIYITEDDNVAVGAVTVTVIDFNSDATTSAVTDVEQSDLVTGNDGNIVLIALNGAIDLTDGANADGIAVQADGTGRILIDARGTNGHLAIAADVVSFTGHITMKAAASIVVDPGIGVVTAHSGTVSIAAENGTLIMAGTAYVTATDSSLRLFASGQISVGNLLAENVSIVSASDSILNAIGSTRNVTALNLRLEAGQAIAASDRHLTTEVSTVTASAAGTGGVDGIYLSEANAITVGTVEVTVTEFNGDATESTLTDATQSGLVTGADGNIVLATLAGSVTVDDDVAADGAGNILLEANGAGSDFTSNADVLSGSGHVTIRAAASIVLAAGIQVSTSADGTVSVTALGGSLEMDGTAAISGTDSSVRLAATGDVLLGNVSGANVSIVSTTGSILNADGSTRNVTAIQLRLEAGEAIGAADRHLTTRVANVAAHAGGVVYLAEETSITVTTVAVTVTEFFGDATLADVTDAAQAGLVSGNNGNIVLTASDGSITVDNDVVADGSGNILLDARGDGNLLTTNADILSSTGHITLMAEFRIILADDVAVATAGGGTVYLNAQTSSIQMSGSSSVAAVDGAIRLRAQGDVSVGNLTAVDVSILSNAGNILNSAGSSLNVAAENLRLEAEGSIGEANRHLTTAVAKITARTNSPIFGGNIYLTEADAVIVTTVGVIVVEVHAGGSTSFVTDADQSDLVTSAGGNIALVTLAGSITLEDGLDNNGIAVNAGGAGSILLDARGAGSELIVDADILSGSGHVTLKAAANIVINASVSITTSAFGSVSLNAATGHLTMAGNAHIGAPGGEIRLAAEGNIVVGNVGDLPAANVSLVSRTASVLNAAGSNMNVTAINLRIEADQAVGRADRHLTTEVSNLTVFAAGNGLTGIFLTEATAVTVSTVGVTVVEFNADNTTTDVTDPQQSGLVTGNGGDIVLVSLDGTITTETVTSANGEGRILLDAGGANSSLMVNSGILSDTGHITLRAAFSVSVAGGVTIATAAGGMVSVEAVTGTVTMAGSANIVAADSNLLIRGAETVTLGKLTAASVAVVSTSGSIFNAANSTLNVIATHLRLEAGVAIGVPDRHLTTAVALLGATAPDGIYITETDGVTVSTIGAFATEFRADGTTADVTLPGLSGLVTTGNGPIVLLALDGDITVAQEVTATGSGNILLQAGGASGELTALADITSGSGDISVVTASGAFFGDVTVSTTGGTIDIRSGASATFVDGALVSTSGGNVRIFAALNILVAGIDAASGKVSLIAAAGSILDGGNAHLDILAAAARLVAGTAIGQPGDPLDINVDVLTALAGTGGISLSEVDGLTVDTVAVTVRQVGTDGESTDWTDAEQSDLLTAGSLALVSGGDVVLNDGVSDNGAAVGAGQNLLLDVDGDLLGNASVGAGGHLSLLATGTIQFAAGTIVGAATGTVDLESGAAITFADGARILTDGGNVRLLAVDDIVLGGIDAGTGKISLISTGGSILDGGDLHLDLVASAARLFAAVGIGQPTNPLDIDVALVTAHSGTGGISLNVIGDVTFGTVSVTVNRVAADFTTSEIFDSAQSGLVTTGSLALVLGGDVILEADLIAGGNVLLQVGGDLTVHGEVRSLSGHISLVAGGSIYATAGALIAADEGTLDLEAGSAIHFTDTAKVVTGGGNVRFLAGTDITLGGIDAGNGSVSLIATGGSILDGGDTDLEVIASALRLWAGTGIGTPTNPLDIDVAILTAHAGTGGISLNALSGLTIDTVSVAVNRVGTDHESAGLIDADQEGLTSGGGLAVAVAGDFTLNATLPDAVDAAGNIRFDVAGHFAANAGILSGGDVSILTGGSIQFASVANLTTTGGTVDFDAGASVLLSDGTLVATNGGNVRFVAEINLTLGGVDAGSGAVSLTARTGTILTLGTSHLDVVASAVRLTSALAIGQTTAPLHIEAGTLTAHTGDGGISLRSVAGLTVDSVAVTVNRVGADFETSQIAETAQADLVTTGSVALVAGGAVVLNSATVAVQAYGRLLLDVDGTLTANAPIHAGFDISLLVAGNIQFASAAHLVTTAGTIDLESNGSVIFADQSLVDSNGGNVRIHAAQSITLGGIAAGAGKVSLIAVAGSILDGGDHHTDVVAAELRLVAGNGIGESSNALDIQVARLTAHAGSGGIYLNEANGFEVGSVSVTVARVSTSFSVTDLVDAEQADLVSGGHLVVVSGGNVTLNSAANAVDAAGNVRFDVTGALIANASLVSGGHVSLISTGTLQFNTGADLVTGGGTADLESGASILFADQSRIVTDGGNVRLLAANNIVIGGIAAGSGDVSLVASAGSILDGGDHYLDIAARALRLQAGNGIGQPTNPLDIRVSTLSAVAGAGGISLNEVDGLTVGAVAVAVQRVAVDGTIASTGDASQAGLVSGGILVLTSGGAVTLSESASATGNILFAITGGLLADADLSTAGGNLSLLATGSIGLESGVALTTAGGSVDLQSGASILFAPTARIASANGNVRLQAATDVQLGQIDAGTGSVAVTATTGSILTGGHFSRDVIATTLLLLAGNGVGEAGQPLRIEVDIVSAHAGTGGVSLNESNALRVASGSVSVNRIGSDGAVDGSVSSAQTGVQSGGSIALVTGGDLTLDAATTAATHILLATPAGLTANSSVATTGGHLSLVVGALIELAAGSTLNTAGGTVDIDAGSSVAMADTARIETSGGNVRVWAGSNITVGGIDAASGTVGLTAASGSILDGGNAHLDVSAGALRMFAGTAIGASGTPLDIRAGSLAAYAVASGIYLNITGNTTVDQVSLAVNRVAADFGLSAVTDAGLAGLHAPVGPIVVESDGNLRLRETVESSGTISLDLDGWLRHDRSGTGAVIATDSNLTIRTGAGVGTTGAGSMRVAADTLAVTNTGAGSVYLTARETIELTGATLNGPGSLVFQQPSGNLRITGNVTISKGHLSLVVAEELHLDHASIQVGGHADILTPTLTAVATPISTVGGSIDLRVTNSLTLNVESPVSASGGDVSLRTGGDLTVGLVKAGGLVNLIAAGDIATSAPNDKTNGFVASHLRIRAGGSIGSVVAPVWVDTDRIDLDAAGEVYLRSAGGLSIGRFGLAIETKPGDEFVLQLAGGVISSAGGAIIDRGTGTLVFQSPGAIVIGALIRSEGGNIRIEAVRVESGYDSETGRIETPEGWVTIIAERGIGSANDAIHFDARWIEAMTLRGPIHLNALGTTTISGLGIVARGGNAPLILTGRHGDLRIDSSIRHLGGGSVRVDSFEGNVSIARDARITTLSGGLHVKAYLDISVSRVESGRGLIHLESTNGSIQRLLNFGSTHVLATVPPVIDVASVVDLRVSADKVIVNGVEIFRRNDPMITLYLVY